jgi:hypothetical protein
VRHRFRGARGAAAALLWSCFRAKAATAAESVPTTDARWPRHLGQVTAHAGAALAGADDDGHYEDKLNYYAIDAAYAYTLHYVEFAAGFGYFAFPDERYPRHAYVPFLAVRPHLPLGRVFDLGLTARAGWTWFVIPDVHDSLGTGVHDHTFSGFYTSLMLDFRVRALRNLAIDLGPELQIGGGKDQSDVNGFYLRDRGGFYGYGGFLRVSLP